MAFSFSYIILRFFMILSEAQKIMLGRKISLRPVIIDGIYKAMGGNEITGKASAA